MKRFATIAAFLMLTTLSCTPLLASSTSLKVIGSLPYGPGVEAEFAFTQQDSIGLYYHNLKSVFNKNIQYGNTILTNVSGYGLEWRHYGKALDGFYYGAGVTFGSLDLQQNVTVSGVATTVIGNINSVFPYLQVGYQGNLFSVEYGTFLRAGYTSGSTNYSSGTSGITFPANSVMAELGLTLGLIL